MNHILAVINANEFNVPKNNITTGTFQNVLQVVFGVAGAIALIIIVLAGFKYVKSRGNPQEVATAKNTIIYAGIGLAVCILAVSIVTFVVDMF